MVLLLLTGCSSFEFNYGKEKWPMPSKFEVKPVVATPIEEVQIDDADGFYISNEHAANLVDNIDELKAYIEKLELLVKKMKKYYGSK